MLPIPVLDQILVKPFAPSDKSEGGIIVPDSCKKRSNKALVLAVGKGTKLFPMVLKEGMTVYNIKDCGDRIIHDGEDYYLMKQSYVLAYE